MNKKKSAFTVIEILVASSIMAVIITVVVAMTTKVLDTWNRSSGMLTRNSDVSIALDYLQQDLEGAFFRNDGQMWMVATPEGAGFAELQQVEQFKGENGMWLRFFTSPQDRPKGTENNPVNGNLNAVSYFIDQINPFDATKDTGKVYSLYRTVADGVNTFENIMGNLEDVDRKEYYSGNESQEDNTDSTFYNSSFIIKNVIGFGVSFTWEENGRIADPTLLNQYFAYNDPGEPQVTRPLYAEVTITVISDEGAKLLEGVESGNVDENIDEIVRKHSTPYTRRINFLATTI